MLGPVLLVDNEILLSDADGTTGREYFYEVPFAALANTVYVEFMLQGLSTSGTVDIDLEDSISGFFWEDTSQAWTAITDTDSGGVYRSAGTFATRARLKVTVSGSAGTTQKKVVAKIYVSGKPF